MADNEAKRLKLDLASVTEDTDSLSSVDWSKSVQSGRSSRSGTSNRSTIDERINKVKRGRVTSPVDRLADAVLLSMTTDSRKSRSSSNTPRKS